MAENKAKAVKQANSNKTGYFQSNHEYKCGDSILIFVGNPTDLAKGIESSSDWHKVYARYNFKSKEQYNPADWTDNDPTPREKVVLKFKNPNVRQASREAEIEIDITDLLKEYFNREDMSLNDEHPLKYVIPYFKEMTYSGVDEANKLAAVRNSINVNYQSVEDLRRSLQELFETSLVNQRQLDAIGSTTDRFFRDFVQNRLLW